jgi:outer membrane lipoprotein-sorting protein
MDQARRLPNRARWAVPVGAVAVVGMVIAGSVLASARAAPALPARSAAQLLADVAKAPPVPSSLSGVIEQSASLGLPQLPDIGGRSSAPSLLAGSHTFKFWYAGPAHVRIAVPVQLGETDLRRDGNQVWLWDSATDTATHILPSLGGASAAGAGFSASGSGSSAGFSASPSGFTTAFAPVSSVSASSVSASSVSASSVRAGSVSAGPSPQQAARQVLAAVGPTTTVRVQQNVMVAGQAAYQLSLAPKDSRSLVGQIRIAIDAHRYLPLRLQVFARGAGSPAYQVGFTSLSFARPAASNFAFTPPPGAKVKTIRLPAPPAGLPSAKTGLSCQIIMHGIKPPLPYGQSNTAGLPAKAARVAKAAASQAMRNAVLRAYAALPKNRSKGRTRAQRMVAQRILRRQLALANGGVPIGLAQGSRCGLRVPAGVAGNWSGFAFGRPEQTGLPQGSLPPGSAPTVAGHGWLSVLVFRLSSGSLTAAAGGPQRVAHPASASQSATAVNGSAAFTPVASGPPPADVMVLRALLRSATPVHGSWGSGRLLRTSLLSVLFTNNGRVLIGAVTPSVLFADAAKAK